jgi:hypothetical protein
LPEITNLASRTVTVVRDDGLGEWREFEFDRFEMPDAALGELEVLPRLASWDAGGTAGQRALGDWLAYAQKLAQPTMDKLTGPLALRLDVRTPGGKHPLVHHDLENYLFPLVFHLGADRFCSVWATKGPDVTPCLHVVAARPRPVDPREWSWGYAITASYATARYKQSVRRATLTDITEEHVDPTAVSFERGVPLAVEVVLGTGTGRNWSNLWKPTVDGLGAILGVQSPDKPWSPDDDRIVRLALHRTTREELRHTVMFDVNAQVPDRTDPLIAWWRPEAPIEALSPLWRAGGYGMIELRDNETLFDHLTDLASFRAAVAADRPIVIAGSAGRKLHPHPRGCGGIQQRYFEAALRRTDADRTRYLVVRDSDAARAAVARLKRCGLCG